MKRFCNVISGLAVATFFLGASAQAAEDFAQCKDRLSTQAIAAGVDEAVVNKAFASVSFVPRVIELDRSQPEFVTTFPSY